MQAIRNTRTATWRLRRSAGRKQYDFISEGDSPAYLWLLDVGLRSQEDPAYGGWGGRFVRSQQNPRHWEDGPHVTDYNPYTKERDTLYPQSRWIVALQNDFASRADWCVKSYDEANHPPRVTLDHAADVEASPGSTVSLAGRAEDPDGDAVTYRWWQYEEAGTCRGRGELAGSDGPEASLVVPNDAKPGETIHVILEVTDSGAPPLTRYARVIVTVGQ